MGATRRSRYAGLAESESTTYTNRSKREWQATKSFHKFGIIHETSKKSVAIFRNLLYILQRIDI